MKRKAMLSQEKARGWLRSPKFWGIAATVLTALFALIGSVLSPEKDFVVYFHLREHERPHQEEERYSEAHWRFQPPHERCDIYRRPPCLNAVHWAQGGEEEEETEIAAVAQVPKMAEVAAGLAEIK